MNFDLFQAVFQYEGGFKYIDEPASPQPNSVEVKLEAPEPVDNIDLPDVEVPESPEDPQADAKDNTPDIPENPTPETIPQTISEHASSEEPLEWSQSSYEPEKSDAEENGSAVAEDSTGFTPAATSNNSTPSAESNPQTPIELSESVTPGVSARNTPTPEPTQLTTSEKAKKATAKQASAEKTPARRTESNVKNTVEPQNGSSQHNTSLAASGQSTTPATSEPATFEPATPAQTTSVTGEKRHLDADDSYASTGEYPPFKRPNVNLSSFAKQLYTRGHNFSFITSTVHLKKPVGEAFTRQDIQLDFMTALFNDETKAFTNNFEEGVYEGDKITFYQLYTRTIAESSSRRVTKLIKAGMLSSRPVGMVVAMLMLMVNAGRMSSRVGFIAKSHSTSSAFNSIPSLQTMPNVNLRFPDSKSFKEIVNIESKDSPFDQRNLEKLIQKPPEQKPNMNVLVLILALSRYKKPLPFFGKENNAYPCYVNFLDFFQESLVHPENRAKRFLWLMYTFLETNFTKKEMAKNPFGADIPPVNYLSQEEAEKFDVDSPAEVTYAMDKYKEHAEWSAHVEKAMEEALRLSEVKRLQYIAAAEAKAAGTNGSAKT
ncbi:hypothetical protein DIURU_004265 [Diutina rugosa]|uniref:Ino eighty subunit 1 n=1 Tax=Diutina rugosa TaxID=5481 RepID=A0A642UI74_DIURU|nr:uncharacterized protein DIURU_004265 [Diutina rugosa]KAA8899598.1 hypothetical protein DIURU_004265 [Diutina rugosa]